MSSTVQLRFEAELRTNPYVPMSEEEMLLKLKKSREQGKFRDAKEVVSDMRFRYELHK